MSDETTEVWREMYLYEPEESEVENYLKSVSLKADTECKACTEDEKCPECKSMEEDEEEELYDDVVEETELEMDLLSQIKDRTEDLMKAFSDIDNGSLRNIE